MKAINSQISVAPQVKPEDMADFAQQGFRSVICNRPDGEGADQPSFEEIEAAAGKLGMEARYLPIVAGKVGDTDAEEFGRLMESLPKPILAYCRTGTRSATLWSLSQAEKLPLSDILSKTKAAGYDMAGVVRRIANGGRTPTETAEDARFDVVIVGGGAAGISVASSLLSRKSDLEIAIIDPADVHYYQPGWTMVGGGIFEASDTAKTMGSLIPKGVHWIKSAVAAFEPKDNAVVLDGCRVVKYGRLVVCPGLKLDWHKVEGLVDTLGKNGVTSNYRYDMAPYTWHLVQTMKAGRALFTQPPMPIKCAGAPQKAMYLSADHWLKSGTLDKIDIQFMNAGGVLFGVKDYVPALMDYVKRYDAGLNFFHNLVAVDGPGKKAVFEVKEPEKDPRQVEVEFDMMHVTPPQT
ncbi:MAG: TIGR01244 family sulfur transferase, partial [Pseudomonadota bacterium]|nr:TIGR01244 family sulfur transferase [Pseudomonadota bacterium]